MPYEFDRYIDGLLMAEGVCIYHASTEEEALEKASAMYARGAAPGEMERTTFVRAQEHRPPLAGDLKMDIVMRLAELAAVLPDGTATAKDAETVLAALAEIEKLRRVIDKAEDILGQARSRRGKAPGLFHSVKAS